MPLYTAWRTVVMNWRIKSRMWHCIFLSLSLNIMLQYHQANFYVLLTVHPIIIFFKWSQPGAHYCLVYLFQLLYMFRATMCSSSGELTVWVAVWSAQTRQPPTQSEKYQCHIDTVSSPDDGHIVAQNMYRSFFFSFFFPMPPHVLCGLRDPPSWAWQECNRLLRLGRPWGAVTLSRWCVNGDRGGCSARRGFKPKFY